MTPSAVQIFLPLRRALPLVLLALMTLGSCSYLGMGGNESLPAKNARVTQLPLPPKPASATATQAQHPAAPPPQLAAASTPGAIRVAILAPLSGDNAELGQAMVDAAQMAVFDLAAPNFELMPRDTGDSATSAANAARDALASGATLILGPLFSASVEAIKPYAAEAHVNILAFSNNEALAGGGTFIMGFTPEAQVARVIAYAKSQGYERIAAIIPESAYGKTVEAALRAAAAADGVTLAGVVPYKDDSAKPDAAIEAAIGALPPSKTYEALLIPEGGSKLKAIAEHLAVHNIECGPVKEHGQIRLLGTGLWDESGLGQAPGLAGGWYAAPDPANRSLFEEHFKATYGHAPPRLATLAYDATALAAVAAKNGWALNASGLTNPNGFAGADGLFRLNANGIAERGLAILEVTGSGNRVVDPAPKSFVQH